MTALVDNRFFSRFGLELKRWIASRRNLLSALVILVVCFAIYYPSLFTGFFADDYNFLEPAVRLPLRDYLIQYFDPRVQILWYRPVQGIQFLVEYNLFGANAIGYHAVQVLIHAADCLLLFAIVQRISQKWRVAFLAALFYATFSVYALAVNWINITDPLMMVFYLLGIWFWWSYLQKHDKRDYVFTLVALILALLTKQMAASLPVVLFLMDVVLVGDKWGLGKTIKRYFPIGVVFLLFFAMQYSVRSTHVYANVFGYSLGLGLFSSLVQYLSLLAFPWGYYPPTDTQITEGLPFADMGNLIWLGIALSLYFFFVWRMQNRVLVFLGLAALITLLPVLPFPFIELRYLYLPATSSAILYALLLEKTFMTTNHPRLLTAFVIVVLAGLVAWDGLAVSSANAAISEIARQRRVPFRDISRTHLTFPSDTFLYFVDPPTPPSELSGMFSLRYGPSVFVGATGRPQSGNLRDHKNAFVYYFDDTGAPRELAVDPANSIVKPSVPVNFAGTLRLENLELARTDARRGSAFVAIFYWRAIAPIDRNYTIFVHLLDNDGNPVAGYDSQPGKGEMPTVSWIPQQRVVDAIVLVIPSDAPIGNNFTLEIGAYNLETLVRLPVVDGKGAIITDHLLVAPVSILQ